MCHQSRRRLSTRNVKILLNTEFGCTGTSTGTINRLPITVPVPVNVIESGATVYALEKSTSISGTGTRNSLYQTIDALTVIVFLSLQSENREYLYFVQWNIDRRHYDIYGK